MPMPPAATPPSILTALTDAALEVIRATPGEYDAGYGFLAVFHGIERPNKVIIRTFHRWGGCGYHSHVKQGQG